MSTLRADAQRNHDRVLVAAAEAFAEHGPDVSANEIARRAGVGHGTVYRRFPSKDALIAAVVSARLGELADRAEALLAEPDAGGSFERFVWDIAELYAGDRGLCEGVPRCAELPEVAQAKARLHALVEQLVSRAQTEGSLRRDISPEDVPLLIGSAIMGATQSTDRELWRRYVAVVLDGLRPPAG
jgi:AcrR family transcriptional regulator